MNAHSASTAHDLRPRHAGRMSLEWKLPIAMTVLLAIGLGGLLAVTYGTLSRRAENIVRDRLVHAVAQLAKTSASLRRSVEEEDALRELVREDVRLFVRNDDGTAWNSASGAPAPAAGALSSASRPGRLRYTRPAVGEVVAEEAALDETGAHLVLEVPWATIIRRPRATIELLAKLSVALLLLGALAAWLIARNITRPLVALTVAAEEIARKSRRPSDTAPSRNEVARLADSLDEMARRVLVGQQELERRANEADAARIEAERANRVKGDFLAMMSHELRTPLNAIGGYAELLEMELYGPISSAQRDALLRVTHNKTHLLTLINDVLHFAQLNAGQVEFKITDVALDELLAKLESLIAPQLLARRITYEYVRADASLTARGDLTKLRQVLVNLLANAIKFTPEDGKVSIWCEADYQQVRIHVHDTGPGIAPDRLTTIFEPFDQGDRALNRPSEGVGLGLAISRDFVWGMGGVITASSTPGNGATFTVTLLRTAPIRGPRVAVPPSAITTRAQRLSSHAGEPTPSSVSAIRAIP